MEVNVWSKVGVDVQSALAAPVTITAITKASPAVATGAAHGYTVGDLLLLKVSGMRQLNYRVVRVSAADVNTFTLEGVDSTNFDTFESGTAEEITFGASCSTLQDVNASGGEAAPILISTVHEDQDYEIPGNRSPIVMSFGSLWVPDDAALLALNAFDEIKTPCAIQIRFATGAKVYFAAFPSVSLAPTGSSGNAVQTPVALRLRGRLTAYAS